LSSSEKKA